MIDPTACSLHEEKSEGERRSQDEGDATNANVEGGRGRSYKGRRKCEQAAKAEEQEREKEPEQRRDDSPFLFLLAWLLVARTANVPCSTIASTTSAG